MSYRAVFSRCPSIEDVYERLVCEIKGLVRAAETLERLLGVPIPLKYKANEWTPLKLAFLKMYIRDVYTPIIGRRYKAMVYLDLLAGPGINRCKCDNKEIDILGSPLIGVLMASYPFTHYVFVESNEKSFRTLKYILGRLGMKNSEKVLLINDDINTRIWQVINFLKLLKDKYEGSVHYLAFIDPEGLDIDWSTIESLIGLEHTDGIVGDLIVLFQGREVARLVGKVRSGSADEALYDRITRFFGNNDWLDVVNKAGKERLEDLLLDLYMRNFKELKRRAIVESTRVKLFRNVHYYLIYVTRRTKRGSAYINSVLWLKNLIEKGDPEKVIKALGTALNIRIDIRKFLRESES